MVKQEAEREEDKRQNQILAKLVKQLMAMIQKTEIKSDGGEQPEEQYQCPHHDRVKIAKNMCSYCYIKVGKTKKAYRCEHVDKPLYSKGMCQICYLHHYYVDKRKKKNNQKK